MHHTDIKHNCQFSAAASICYLYPQIMHHFIIFNILEIQCSDFFLFFLFFFWPRTSQVFTKLDTGCLWAVQFRSQMKWLALHGRGLHLKGLATSKGQGPILRPTRIWTGDLSLCSPVLHQCAKSPTPWYSYSNLIFSDNVEVPMFPVEILNPPSNTGKSSHHGWCK